MPGPALVVLMLAPVVAAGALAGLQRRRVAMADPLRALWLVPVVVLATVLAMRLQATSAAPDQVVNRVLAGLVVATSVGFVLANRAQASTLVRTGVRLSAAGAAANATATLIYGSMPVLAASVRALGSDVRAGDHPHPEYVAVHASQLPALLLGDVLPVPALDSVISLGDLLLAPGCTILLAVVLAPLLRPLPATPREGVNP